MTGFGMNLGHYIRRGLAFRWVVLLPAVIVFALVTVYITLQPDTYESAAILGSPLARSGDTMMRADADASAREAIRSAQQRLLSTSMLMRVSEETNPYPETQAEFGIDGVIDRLRKKLIVDVNHGASTITVTFAHNQGEKPAEMASNVVNCLVENFVTDMREAMGDTSAKYKRSLDRAKKDTLEKLNRSENDLNEFRRVHQGSLPEDVESNRKEIHDLTAQVNEYIRSQKSARDEMLSLGREQMRFQQVLEQGDEEEISTSEVIHDAEEHLQRLNEALIELLATRSKDHKDVREMQERIRLAEERLNHLRETESKSSNRQNRVEMVKFLLDDISKRKESLTADIGQLDTFIAKCQESIKSANDRIAKSGSLLNQLTSLTRAVDEYSTQYRDVVARLSALDQRGAAGAEAPAIPIEVLQRASPGAKPASPDRLASSLIGLALGLGIGIGLAVAKTKVDNSYHRAEDLRALLPGAVLITVPEVTSGGARASRVVAGALGGLFLFAVFCATVALLGSQLGWWEAPQLFHTVLNLRK